MAVPVSQLLSSSFASVVNLMRKPANQWGDSSGMQAMEDLGFVKRVPGGSTIEMTLDYRINPSAGFQDFDLDELASGKTEVITAAVYTPRPFSYSIVWSKADEAMNSSENQKIAFVKALIENGVNSHDNLFEQALATTSTNSFLGFQTINPDSGQGTVGGVSAVTETWWRNQVGTYLDDGTDLQSQATAVYNAASKGSGANSVPKLWLSDGATSGLFESTQVAFQRYSNTQTIKAGATKLMFKTCQVEFSQYFGTRINLLNPDAVKLIIFQGAWRQEGETQELERQQGYRMNIFSMGQLCARVKSRLGLLTSTAA